MIQITVRLFATLRENRERELPVSLPERSTVHDVLDHLNISLSDAAITMINSRGVKIDTPLSHRDILSIFPPIGGG